MYEYEKIISICEITGEDNRMTRLADIKDGYLSLPKIDGSYKGYQRDRLFYNQQKTPMTSGQLGVWEWYVDENDRVISTYLDGYEDTFFEVIKKYSTFSKEALAKQLKEGVDLPDCKHNRLILFKKKLNQSDKENYSAESNRILNAVLCKSFQWKVFQDRIRLKNDVYYLPCFNIYEGNILNIDIYNNRSRRYLYYRYKLPEKNESMFISHPNDVIKQLLIEKLNKRYLMKNGIYRKGVKQIHELIKQFPNEEIPEKILSYYPITFEEAKEIWNIFQNKLDQFVQGDDIDSKILKSLLKEDDILRQRLKDEWLEAYDSELKQEKEKIFKEQEIYADRRRELEQKKQELENVYSEHQKKLALIQQEMKDAEERLEKAKENAVYYEQLSEKSLCLVREKLNLARKEAAEFLADLALFGTSEKNADAASSYASSSDPFFFQSGKPTEDQEDVRNTEESLELLQDNLKMVGAAHEKELAHFLYGAFQSRIPLLLAGPQGAAVADALSCAMTGHHAAVLDCCGAWTPTVLECVLHDDTAVIVVKHPFLHRWIDQLIPELEDTGKMWIFVHPYADDLPLEPVSLYSYIFPLVLDIFITGKTSGSMVGCRRSSEYHQSGKCEDVKNMVNSIKFLSRKPTLKNNVRELTAWACATMNERYKEFFHFSCLLFPFAVALDRKNKFLEKLGSENNLSSTDRRFLEGALGEQS
ncbi:hypothetical protein [Desulfovibrio sp. ZJ200]|uniref:hypothetical protein n=1 Tax=Desulfovibrio sp. ZJ200 TaxID=2709792 RepID=UPI0013ECA60B|nr:hypothetical protein [Desulfovibrio sp. ZJ200]